MDLPRAFNKYLPSGQYYLAARSPESHSGRRITFYSYYSTAFILVWTVSEAPPVRPRSGPSYRPCSML